MSTDEMLWVILQDRRRQAEQAARERLAIRARRPEGVPDASTDVRPSAATHRRLRPADGVPGR